MDSTPKGFTIVELLIVIVVIGILAAISIVSYNGIQARGRDAQRLSDMNTIVKALEIYKAEHGEYPPHLSHPSASGWEISVTADTFLSRLRTGNISVSSVPVDPINKVETISASGAITISYNADNKIYFYHRYSAGNSGCDVSRGNFYILGVLRMDGVPAGQNHPESPGFSCPSRNWSGTGAWVTGKFTN